MPHGLSISDPIELPSVLRWVTEQTGARWAPRLELVCAEHPNPARGAPHVEVIGLPGCAAQIPSYVFLELLVAGAHNITVRLDGCAQAAQVHRNLEPILGVFAATGLAPLVLSTTPPQARRRRTVLDANRMPVSRRRLLTLGLSGTAADAKSGTELPPTPDLSQSPPQREAVALRYLLTQSNLSAQQIVSALQGLDSPAARLAAPGCVACNVCVRSCPSDALRLSHSGPAGALTVSTLLQRPALCNGCNVCVASCPKDVLSVAGTWDWATTLFPPNSTTNTNDHDHVKTPATVQELVSPIVTLTTATCERCNTRFPSTEATNLCQVCSYRRKNPFASMMPPDFRPPSSTAR